MTRAQEIEWYVCERCTCEAAWLDGFRIRIARNADDGRGHSWSLIQKGRCSYYAAKGFEPGPLSVAKRKCEKVLRRAPELQAELEKRLATKELTVRRERNLGGRPAPGEKPTGEYYMSWPLGSENEGM